MRRGGRTHHAKLPNSILILVQSRAFYLVRSLFLSRGPKEGQALRRDDLVIRRSALHVQHKSLGRAGKKRSGKEKRSGMLVKSGDDSEGRFEQLSSS